MKFEYVAGDTILYNFFPIHLPPLGLSFRDIRKNIFW